jgi:steroid delta-isomerase-like uncharacterized protein
VAEGWGCFDTLSAMQQLGATVTLPGQAVRSSDQAEQNKAVVRRFAEEVWNQGNLDALDELVTRDVARNGQQLGVEGMGGVVAMIRGALPDLRGEILDLIAEGDKVVWRYVSRGTHRGPLMGVPATGRRVEYTGTATLRLVDGRIAAIWDNVDLLAVFQQIGALPPIGHAAG